MASGRLSEEQSRMNWVSVCGGMLWERIPEVGCTLATVFINSGKSLDRTSEVVGHDTSACSILSGLSHREQVRLTPGCVKESLSFVM